VPLHLWGCFPLAGILFDNAPVATSNIQLDTDCTSPHNSQHESLHIHPAEFARDGCCDDIERQGRRLHPHRLWYESNRPAALFSTLEIIATPEKLAVPDFCPLRKTKAPMKSAPDCVLPRFARLFGLFLAGLLVSVEPAAAQTTSQPASPPKKPDETVELDPYTIVEGRGRAYNSRQTFSGSRIAQDLLDVPMNISIVNEEFMRDIGAQSVLDILYYAASGVNSRVSYRDDISIRGFRQETTFDGMRLVTYGTNPLYDIERLEIIKGPTGLVFSDATNIGGTINYVSKRPTTKSKGDLMVAYGSENTMIGSITQRGPLTHNGGVRYRVTAGGQQYDGFREEEYDNNRLLSGSVDWTINPKLELRTDVRYFDAPRRDFNRDLVDPATLRLAAFFPDDFSTSALWGKVRTYVYSLRSELIYRVTPELTLRLLGSTSHTDYYYRVPQPTPGLRIAQAPSYTTIGQRYLKFDLVDVREDVQGDITWTKRFGGIQNRLTAGWAWGHADNTQDLYTGTLADIVISQPISARPSPPPITALTVASLTASRSGGWTAYAQDAVTFMEGRLSASVGYRYVDKSSTTTGVSEFVPRFGAVFKVVKNVSLYAGHAESYRPTSGFDIFGKALVDITGENQEVGVKFDLFDGRVFGTVAYFDILNDPVITQVQGIHPVTGVLVFGNAQTGKETNKGLEADLGFSVEVGPGNWLAFATYYDTKPKDATGLTPFRVVSEKHTAFTKYELTSGPLKGVGIGAGLSYFGESRGTGIPVQPDFTLYNALLQYRTSRWGIALNLDNLTNEKNAIVGSEANFSVYTARPFNWKVSYTRNW
jgi:iron complex outermembrane recepter protein